MQKWDEVSISSLHLLGSASGWGPPTHSRTVSFPPLHLGPTRSYSLSILLRLRAQWVLRAHAGFMLFLCLSSHRSQGEWSLWTQRPPSWVQQPSQASTSPRGALLHQAQIPGFSWGNVSHVGLPVPAIGLPLLHFDILA